MRWWRTLAVLIFSAVMAGIPLSAHAESTYDSWDVTYEIQPSGQIRVTEKVTIAYDTDKPHEGYARRLVLREPLVYDPNNILGPARIYRITDATITSDIPGSVSSQVQSNQRTSEWLRVEYKTNADMAGQTATFVTTYTLSDALIADGDQARLSWDAVPELPAPVTAIKARVVAPNGAPITAAQCYDGPAGAANTCGPAQIDGSTASMSMAGHPHIFTIDVRFPRSSVASVGPVTGSSPYHEWLLGMGGCTGTAVATALGWGWWRRRTIGRDERYTNLAPGIVPSDHESPTVGRSPRTIQIPVRFDPPHIDVATAGVLMDQRPRGQHVAALLSDLTGRGVLRMSGGVFQHTGTSAAGLEPVEESVANIFRDPKMKKKKRTKNIAKILQGNFAAAEKELLRGDRPTRNGWAFALFGCLLLAIGAAMAWVMVSAMWQAPWWLVALVIAVVVLTITTVFVSPGRRGLTAQGRALMDQIEGYRTFLATADAQRFAQQGPADQVVPRLRAALPWAVLFGLETRWQEMARAFHLPEAEVAIAHTNASDAWDKDTTYGFTASDGYRESSSSGSGGSDSSSDGSSGGGDFSGGGGGGGGAEIL